MEETGVRGENHRLAPANFLTCPGRDSNPDSGERQHAVIGGALDHTKPRIFVYSWQLSHKAQVKVKPQALSNGETRLTVGTHCAIIFGYRGSAHK